MSSQEEQRPLLSTRASSPYLDVPLTPSNRQIRLLELSPSLTGGRLEGHLLSASLHLEPQYEALSYAWGSADNQRSIRINGKHDVSITDNLFDALRRLRFRFRKRVLWIDAVCINQSGPEEKGRQVAMMDEIFAKASQTLIWLGDAPGIMPFSLVPLWYLQRCRLGDFKIPYEAGTFGRVLLDNLRNYPLLLEEALARTQPPWASRTWTQQEYVLSRKIALCFASYCRPLDQKHMCSMLLFAKMSGYEVNHASALYDHITRLILLQERHALNELDLCIAAERTFVTDATDPRDKVYSLLGLIDRSESERIVVDYRLRTAQVFAQATFVSMKSRGFDILESLGNHHRSRLDGLPSWAADFSPRQLWSSARGHSFRGPDLEETTRKSLFDQMDSVNACRKRLALSSDSRTLTIRALRLDTVDHVLMGQNFVTSGREFSGQDGYDEWGRAVDEASGLANLLLGIKPDGADPESEDARVKHMDLTSRIQTDGGYTHVGLIQSTFKQWDASNLRTGMPTRAFKDGEMRVTDFLSHAMSVHGSARVVVLSSELLGLGLSSIQPGDQLVLAQEARLPLVLRQEGDQWTFQGFAYVHALAYGQLLKQWADQGKQLDKFVLC